MAAVQSNSFFPYVVPFNGPTPRRCSTSTIELLPPGAPRQIPTNEPSCFCFPNYSINSQMPSQSSRRQNELKTQTFASSSTPSLTSTDDNDESSDEQYSSISTHHTHSQTDTTMTSVTSEFSNSISCHTQLIGTISFNVGSRYRVCDVIGEGAYGVVCSAVHRASGQRVAIKKIQPFEHQMFALRTLRELKLLRYFQECEASENIISILDIVKPPNYDSFSEVYLIQELMETDLHRVIRTQDLSDDHSEYVTTIGR